MNIKELIEWRQYCFFCNDELAIVPEIKVEAKFSIDNNYFTIESRFVNLSIHVETGEIIIPNVSELEKDKIMVDEFFLQRFDFKIVCKCLSCVENGREYQYYGSISFDTSIKSADVSLLIETFSFNSWAITQQKDRDLPWESMFYLKKNPEYKFSLKDKMKISFLDLKKLTPEKLENKIKTYIVFS